MPELPTAGSDSGSSGTEWPTANVPNGGRGLPLDTEFVGGTAFSKGRKVQVELAHAVALSWPTPAASTGEGGAHGLDGGAGARAMLAKGGGLAWPTPDAMVANDGQDAETYESRRRRLQEKHRNGNGAGLVLAQAARRTAWPTATATDAASAQATGPASSRDRDLVASEVMRWASASASDAKGSRTPEQRRGQLSSQTEPGNVGALNPDWVACLMGWPVGWDDATRPLPQPVTFSPWPAPPGPQHPWEPPRLTARAPGRTARLRMLGNGQVPATAVLAWRLLHGPL